MRIFANIIIIKHLNTFVSEFLGGVVCALKKLFIGFLLGLPLGIYAGKTFPPMSKADRRDYERQRLCREYADIIDPLMQRLQEFRQQLLGNAAPVTSPSWGWLVHSVICEFLRMSCDLFDAPLRDDAACTKLARMRDFLRNTRYAERANNAYYVVNAFVHEQVTPGVAKKRLRNLFQSVLTISARR